jgi:hypothetical protein
MTAGPMIARLLAKRQRVEGFHEYNDESWLVYPSFVLRFEPYRIGVVLAWGPHRWGVAWRKFATTKSSSSFARTAERTRPAAVVHKRGAAS